MKEKVIEQLQKRGVQLDDIAGIVYDMQSPYNEALTLEECLHSTGMVIEKREVQHVIMTGLALDKLAEQGLIDDPLLSIILSDEPLYGVDETLAMGIATIYGTIGITSFGYLDKVKPGIMAHLDKKEEGRANTFLDDIVAGIAAAAAARIAHTREVGEIEDDIS